MAGKLGPFLHQIEDRVFSIAADDRQVLQIHDHSASPQSLASTSLRCAKLANPWSDEGSFHD
jgi:hypothetical protein